MRWALFGPTPGSRPSSSIRSWTAPSYVIASIAGRRSQSRQAETAEVGAAGERAHRVAGQLADARCASRTAATTRSCSVSMSSGSTTDGSIVSAVSSPEPSIVAVTRPPPAVPVTSVAASSACAASSLLLHLLRLLHQLLHVRLTAESATARVHAASSLLGRSSVGHPCDGVRAARCAKVAGMRGRGAGGLPLGCVTARPWRSVAGCTSTGRHIVRHERSPSDVHAPTSARRQLLLDARRGTADDTRSAGQPSTPSSRARPAVSFPRTGRSSRIPDTTAATPPTPR